MPFATNAADGTRVYFEDDGGAGTPVVLYGGILDSTELVRREPIPLALRELAGEFRLIYADHRGLGRSDKPHDVASYAMPLQAMDAVAVLDELGIEQAHFAGASYGGRLCFGIGEHAADRALSLVAGGQQPYAIDPDGPLARVVSGVLNKTRREGAVAFVEALEAVLGNAAFPDEFRAGYLAQDGAAVAAAAEAMLIQGDISGDLRAWSIPCLIYLGAGDADFFEQARRAADEIPNAEFVGLEGLDHLGAHFMSERIIPAVLRMLRGASGGRARHEAEPSHGCGAPAQHQPRRGLPPLTQSAGTRRSPRREPSNENAFCVASTSGNCPRTARPSSIVSGERPRARISGRASSGVTSKNSAPRSTSRNVYDAAAGMSTSTIGL